MEAASTSEMLVNFYQTTRRNNPGDSHLHTRRRENLKSHLITVYSENNTKPIHILYGQNAEILNIKAGVLYMHTGRSAYRK
jgi:uracil DNA glycosylase